MDTPYITSNKGLSIEAPGPGGPGIPHPIHLSRLNALARRTCPYPRVEGPTTPTSHRWQAPNAHIAAWLIDLKRWTGVDPKHVETQHEHSWT